MNIFYAFVHSMMRLVLKVLFRLEVKGRDNIPKRGGVILAANHTSFLDPVVASIASPRQVYFLAREELFQLGFFSWIIKNLNALPISRERMQISIARQSLGILRKGGALLLFPEGTRSPVDTIAEGKRGVGLIAAKTNVPVIPVFIKGSGHALPRNRKWITSHKVWVTFGKPLYFENLENTTNKETHQEFSDRIMEEIRKLVP